MPTPPPPNYPAVNQFLLAEDDALKTLIEGIVVPGDKSGRTVPVHFRFPETEKQLIYPFITIDLIGIDPAYDLWTSVYFQDEQADVFEDETTAAFAHAGLHEPSVAPSVWDAPVPPDPTKPLRRLNYLPYRLYYQITTWSKYFAHDRVMTAKLLRDVIMPRPAWLRVPSDGTWKRMEPLGWSAADMPTQEGNIKRIFRKVFTVSVQTEIPQDNLAYITQQAEVRRVMLRGDLIGTNDHWTADETTDYWEVLVGPSREVSTAMTPGDYPLAVYRGDSYQWRFVLWTDKERTVPTDLTGATVKAQIHSGALVFNLGTAIVLPNFVDVTLSAATSAELPATGKWDLEVTQNGDVRTVVAGSVVVTNDVTK